MVSNNRKHKSNKNNNFKCGICSKLFRDNYDLKIHLRTHRKESCEKCNYCSKKFCDPATLRKHIKYIHVDNGLSEKQFICRKCHKRFKYKNSLKTHLQTIHKFGQHRNITKSKRRIYKCPVNECEKSFTYKSNCNAHLRRFHPNCNRNS